jgi:hypothetical protein
MPLVPESGEYGVGFIVSHVIKNAHVHIDHFGWPSPPYRSSTSRRLGTA